MDPQPLKEFFEPLSVAVIGASENPQKIGHVVLKNLIEAGYAGNIFPINPNASEVLGLKAYPSIENVPAPVDLVVIVIPSKSVPVVMQECARKKVKAVVIISGGFREIGEYGKQLETDLIKTAKKAGIRVIGPNCQGINNPRVGLCATFGGFSKLPGPIAIITQSGTVGAAIQCWADREGIGISKCVNLGNKVDVDEVDLLQCLKNDKDTRVIVLYVEGLASGRTFMDVATEVSRTKPIVALKGGTTKAGQKAAFSHTSSLAGTPEMYEAAFKKAGIVKANSLEELYDIAKAFSFLPLPKGPGVLIIESTGGCGVIAADMCERFGLKLPEPDKEAINKLRKVLPDTCTFSNPFDLTTEAFQPNRFRLVIEENMDNEEFQAFLVIFGDPIQNAAEEIKKVSVKTTKPIIVSYLGGGEVELTEKAKMHSMGIPVFPTPERAVIALHALLSYSRYLERVGVQ
ncbi:MAG: acetate--CoA ligase family protein [Candidatus Bathyarchaeota archaeon]